MIYKKQQLRKHKRIATGLFLLMALVYVIMLVLSKNNFQIWMGYVKAFSEAGMVGALADWFAVTALFKYPLGLKIPHTNLINNNKDALGENLGAFVTENFINKETIRPYVTQIDLSGFLVNWLSNKRNQQNVEVEVRNIFIDIVQKLDDEQIINLLSKKGSEIISNIKLEKLVSNGLYYLVENNEHQRLITSLVPEAKLYVENNKEAIYKKVVEKNPILGLIGGKAVTNQLISGIVSFLDNIETNGGHPLRNEISTKLIEFSEVVKDDSDWIARLNTFKSQFLSEEFIHENTSKLWITSKTTLIENLIDENSLLNEYIKRYLNEIRFNLETNSVMQLKINKTVHKFIYTLALRNSQEIGNVISKTVKAWDGKEMSTKLELEVGKDLQYIRINGTLVGGLVGLIIYVLTQFFI